MRPPLPTPWQMGPQGGDRPFPHNPWAGGHPWPPPRGNAPHLSRLEVPTSRDPWGQSRPPNCWARWVPFSSFQGRACPPSRVPGQLGTPRGGQSPPTPGTCEDPLGTLGDIQALGQGGPSPLSLENRWDPWEPAGPSDRGVGRAPNPTTPSPGQGPSPPRGDGDTPGVQEPGDRQDPPPPAPAGTRGTGTPPLWRAQGPGAGRALSPEVSGDTWGPSISSQRETPPPPPRHWRGNGDTPGQRGTPSKQG